MKLQRPLFLVAILIAIFPAAIPQAEATESTDQCPRFQFNPPEAYKGSMKSVSYTHLTLPTICSV